MSNNAQFQNLAFLLRGSSNSSSPFKVNRGFPEGITPFDLFKALNQSYNTNMTSDMAEERPKDYIIKKEEEDDKQYNKPTFTRNLVQDFTFKQEEQLATSNSSQFIVKQDPHAIEEETNFCSEPENEKAEDMGSDATKGNGPTIGSVKMEHNEAKAINQNINRPISQEVESLLNQKAAQLMQKLTDEDREYAQAVMPTLIESFQNVHPSCLVYVIETSFDTMVAQLIKEKQNIAEAETLFVRELVKDEIRALKINMPDNIIDENDLNTLHRRDKKVIKGNKNASSLNHINENYISNIFQFAKKNFPEDKEIQRIANIRNVSASAFKKMFKSRITDSSLTRRAKLRIVEIGRELLSNIEYWMNEGYFEQCRDREKYIYYKYKALVDLALIQEEF